MAYYTKNLCVAYETDFMKIYNLYFTHVSGSCIFTEVQGNIFYASVQLGMCSMTRYTKS